MNCSSSQHGCGYTSCVRCGQRAQFARAGTAILRREMCDVDKRINHNSHELALRSYVSLGWQRVPWTEEYTNTKTKVTAKLAKELTNAKRQPLLRVSSD